MSNFGRWSDLWAIDEDNSYVVLKVKMLKWRYIARCYPHEAKLIKCGMTSKKRSSSDWICILIWLEYRYAVLSRGMYHKKSWLCLSAQVTQESWWETQKPHVHMTWVWQRQTRWHRFCVSWANGYLFEISVTPVSGNRWHRISLVATASFLGGMGI